MGNQSKDQEKSTQKGGNDQKPKKDKPKGGVTINPKKRG